LASANVYNLKHVDYSELGQAVEIIVNGIPKRQTVIFSGTDYFGEKYYFTEEGRRYITDSRNDRSIQKFVMKSHTLRFNYSKDFDILEIWLPEFDTDSITAKYEPGLYDSYSCARLKGAPRAFDSLLVDAFSAAYPRLLAEVKHKEPPIEQENYDVPELGFYRVQLSKILEEIYCRFVAKKESSRQEIEVFAA
jgi:hypothetical protein